MDFCTQNITMPKVAGKEGFMRKLQLKWKRIGAIGTALALAVSTLTGIGVSAAPQEASAATDYGLSNPRVEMQTRDVIEFGSYWQEDTNSDGAADQKDKKTPIKWQILKQDGDDLFLLADQALDCKPYNEEDTDVTWETCTLRSWLNSDFYDAAFSDSEKAAIKQTSVSNEDNPYYGTEGGNDTTDRLFLLSLSEIVNTDYGFQSRTDFYDQARHAKATDYAKAQGCYTGSEGTSWWWLRSPGDDSGSATNVNYVGYVLDYGGSVDIDGSGVRPALHVNAANAAISSALVNKTTEEVALAKTTWDTVEFGTYNGAKINWRVLSVDGDDAFLLADRILLEKEYNVGFSSVTWETSTLRKWLNDDFYKEAFASEEQTAINKTTITNEDNPFYGTAGGNNTEDSIYLLSLSDIVNKSYGFPTAYGCESASRQAVPTDIEDTSRWWLRSPGFGSGNATSVGSNGYVYDDGYDVNYGSHDGVRPALHLNLSSSVWKKGEVVTSDDKKEAITDSLPSGNGGESGSSNNDKQEEESGSSGTSTNSGSQNTDNQNTNTMSGSSPAVSGTNNGSDTTAKASTADGTTVTVTAPAKVKSIKATNKKKGKTVVSFKKVTGAAGYQIQYAKNKKFTKGKKSKTTKKTKYTIKKLTKKKTYYFRVRAYKLVNGTKKYGKWSAVKKLKIKK